MKVKIKTVEGATIPKYATEGSSGMDLHANIKEYVRLYSGNFIRIPTGIFVEIPEGYEFQVRPRSGLAMNHKITVINTPGTIDSDFRGEIIVGLFNHGSEAHNIHPGDKIAQMVLCPVIKAEWDEVQELSKTVRGIGGIGSTGV